jgi:general secretion pathway protein G
MRATAVNARERNALPGASTRDDRSGHTFEPFGLAGCKLFGRAGFTLVELLIAVAIVAVLVAIAVPSYKSYRDRVLVAQAQTDIISLGPLIAQYRLDNRVFPNSLADIGKADLLDPWKHPYVYVNLSDPNAKPRKDKNLHPLNSDYDLCSMGPDGDTKLPLTAQASRDDILRANDGRFVGLASDY